MLKLVSLISFTGLWSDAHLSNFSAKKAFRDCPLRVWVAEEFNSQVLELFKKLMKDSLSPNASVAPFRVAASKRGSCLLVRPLYTT